MVFRQRRQASAIAWKDAMLTTLRQTSPMQFNVVSFCAHVFSTIKFAHARTVRSRLSRRPAPVFLVKPCREPGDEAKLYLKHFTSVIAMSTTLATMAMNIFPVYRLSNYFPV